MYDTLAAIAWLDDNHVQGEQITLTIEGPRAPRVVKFQTRNEYDCSVDSYISEPQPEEDLADFFGVEF